MLVNFPTISAASALSGDRYTTLKSPVTCFVIGSKFFYINQAIDKSATFVLPAPVGAQHKIFSSVLKTALKIDD